MAVDIYGNFGYYSFNFKVGISFGNLADYTTNKSLYLAPSCRKNTLKFQSRAGTLNISKMGAGSRSLSNYRRYS